MTTPFPSRLREARTAAGLRQGELSTRAGLGKNIVNDLERGSSLPTAYTLLRLADTLGVSCDWLLGRTDERGVRR